MSSTPSFHSLSDFVAIGTEAVTLRTGFRRSRRHGALGPFRPVTLRGHFSMALPLSKSRQNQPIRFAASRNLLLFVPFRFDHRLQEAGRKSIGYVIVTACTPSLAPKLMVRTRFTTCVARSGAFMSVDCSVHIDTLPSGSIVRRSTILPCNAGLLRNSRL